MALARKLLVGLWRYLERGVVPTGATVVEEKGKMTGPKVVAALPA